jgi:multiple sugar transport system substrate-binding protein
MRRGIAAGVVAAGALFLAACGSSGGGSTTSSSSGSSKQAPTFAQASAAKPKGTVTYCTGQDTSGAQIQSVKLFNQQYKSQGLSAKLLQFPQSADEQRNQFIQREQAKSPECDIFFSDVIWTAEFASQKWLMDMSNYIKSRASEFIPSTLDTAHYQGKYWGVPQASDAAFLFYRTDKIASTPTTWQQAYADAQKSGGIVYQGAAYEGLTCDYLELAFAAGGQVLSPDGKKSVINSPQNLAALQFMVNGIKSGAAPKANTTYMEENARRAFEQSKAVEMRNWTYAYALGQMSSIKNKFKVVPLPSWQGKGKAGILGGHDLVISAYSKNPNGALLLIHFLTSPKIQSLDAAKYSLAPVLNTTYDDPVVKKALPYTPQLRLAIAQAKARPVSPVYPQISEAIYNNVNKALSGEESPQDALKNADSAINKALSTF